MKRGVWIGGKKNGDFGVRRGRKKNRIDGDVESETGRENA